MKRWKSSILIPFVILMTGWITGSFAGSHSAPAPRTLTSAQRLSHVSRPDGLPLDAVERTTATENPARPTKAPPAPAPVAAPSPTSVVSPPRQPMSKPADVSTHSPQQSTPSSVGASDLGGAWACIREKESSNNYQSHGSRYYGAYQFDRGTWIANGGDPNTYGSATPAEQDRVAQTTQSRRGWSPWPATSRMCHLR